MLQASAHLASPQSWHPETLRRQLCYNLVKTSHSLLCWGSGLPTWECRVNCLKHRVPHPELHPEWDSVHEADNKARSSSSDTTSFLTRARITWETFHYDRLLTFALMPLFVINRHPVLIIHRVHQMQLLHLVPVAHLFFVFSWCMKLLLVQDVDVMRAMKSLGALLLLLL